MFTLNCVSQLEKPPVDELLEAACKKLKVRFNLIRPDTFDFTNIPNLGKNDLYYRVSTFPLASLVEQTLLNNSNCASFFQDNNTITNRPDTIMKTSLILERYGLPVIPTVYAATNNKTHLKKAADQLAGFPIILKASGGSHGVGVMRIDSLESLYSVADFIYSSGTICVLKKYIDYKYHARVIVLGDKVIDSIQYHRVQNDFRSNAGEDLHVEPMKFSKEIEESAIKAVDALGSEFGGIDILIDDTGYYIAEVNMPCFFPRCQLLTGVNIAEQMVEYLIKKAQSR